MIKDIIKCITGLPLFISFILLIMGQYTLGGILIFITIILNLFLAYPLIEMYVGKVSYLKAMNTVMSELVIYRA